MTDSIMTLDGRWIIATHTMVCDGGRNEKTTFMVIQVNGRIMASVAERWNWTAEQKERLVNRMLKRASASHDVTDYMWGRG